MAEQIRVRLYNVRFGDAILVTVPDLDDAGAPLDRHLLVDVGNVLTGEGGRDDVYRAVLEDIRAVTSDHGVDLYVMTHEHMDHVQGLLYGATVLDPPVTLDVHTVWMTRSADPGYYDEFDDARKAFDRTLGIYGEIEQQLRATADDDPRLALVLANNNPRSTGDCVRYLRDELVDPAAVHYVHRGFDTTRPGAHPFRRATFDIWAPEEDASVYYGRFRPMAFGDPEGAGVATAGAEAPPAGVDATAFFELVDARARGAPANALAIDKARNNTSVVFTLTWNDRVLLFAGDAETRSWRTMAQRHRDPDEDFEMVPVDFLKVGHHGSHNGTPSDDVLDIVLPVPPPAPHRRQAGVSTCADTYGNVPDPHTADRLGARVDALVSTATNRPFQDLVID